MIAGSSGNVNDSIKLKDKYFNTKLLSVTLKAVSLQDFQRGGRVKR